MVRKKTLQIVKNHILIPKHEVLSDKQKQDLLSTYKITIRELPKILIGDPAIFDLEVKSGDIIKITRQSSTAGTSVFYRVVSDV